MTNQYYNFDEPAQPGTLVDPFAYNREMTAITEAFDGIPPASQLSSGTLNFSLDTGVANAYVATLDSFPAGGYEKGSNVALQIGNTSTGASTLSINGFPVTPIAMAVVGAVAAGDLKDDGIYTFVYDGANFQCLEMSSRFFAAAQTSATNAAASASAAALSAANASSSATAANNSKNAAATSATSASGSATSASGSASSAATSATTASQQATAAGNSQAAAATSATAAGNSQTAAAGSASAAATSATNASNSASAASTSATNAANSAASAAAAEDIAEDITTSPTFVADCTAAILELELFPGSVEFFAVNEDPNTTYPGTTWVRLPESVTIRTANATGTDVYTQVGSDTVTLTTNTLPAHDHSVTPGTVSTTDLGTDTTSSFDYGTDTLATFTDSAKTSSSFDYTSKTTAAFDFASATTSSSGAHNHTFAGVARNTGGTLSGMATTSNVTSNLGDVTLPSAGAHTHTFDLGAHTHTVALGAHTHTYALNTHTHTVGVGANSHTFVMGSHNHAASVSVANFGSGTAFSVVNSSLILVAWYRSA